MQRVLIGYGAQLSKTLHHQVCKGPGWGRGGDGRWGRGWIEEGMLHLCQVSWRSAPENEGNQQSGFASFQSFESLPISPCSSKALPAPPGSTPPPLPAQDVSYRSRADLCCSGLLVSTDSTSHMAFFGRSVNDHLSKLCLLAQSKVMLRKCEMDK